MIIAEHGISSTGEIMVTNDGATILKAIALDNAAAKVLVNISKVQDDEVGDGTTSVTVLAAELLREAEKLVDQKIHPQTIIEGYRIASNAALQALEKIAVDHSSDEAAFRKDLEAIARTTLSSKVLSQDTFSSSRRLAGSSRTRIWMMASSWTRSSVSTSPSG
jgi:T-complex protein 1 subunit beta